MEYNQGMEVELAHKEYVNQDRGGQKYFLSAKSTEYGKESVMLKNSSSSSCFCCFQREQKSIFISILQAVGGFWRV
jgi:hypothetical protein